ncbi:MAG: tRNA (N6-threonylcarbamoyladenosine(37)-N6)-methyltransferase TrmO [Syntrophomonas sp.]|uniref:tRNA (N6-threonylcarbamoyladenosine(37)-N6)-methyltransferase TrmO n=1 Tax=Syntrophomonas sp. TaxID=2053627 RepID=UPI0026116443|nr:tRNA (N6-threonylcarbamoyladenosine(37)-N6)-methyltransferase TrmO [Syntrophomonas sp.]MDD3879085.1 tRNA (N6-threonylcarbamoyladenosine(37)-N6)-methyltransferase TrmO [Syntrophomonas sp.]MDD4626858.1 tRNA (N6-threonylcarbamoyladenosine(37)-N6)-methyltransferase TrmO [Syntrophomonas sp.]
MFDIRKEPVSIQPIGVVVSDFKEVSRQYDYKRESMIYMREDLMDALIGIEYFSHIHVIYYQHRKQDWLEMTGTGQEGKAPLTLPFDSEPACQGVYSTRSPARPSSLGYCVVELVKCEQNRLYVRGLDAIDGTPVLDIKIYIPHFDAFPLAEIPLNWCKGDELKTTSRAFHWDTINVGLSLGLRVGAKALQVLGIARGGALRAEVRGGYFFAQGVEGVTGCSVLRGNMILEENRNSFGDWKLKLVGPDNEVEIRLNEYFYSEAREVLELGEEALFASVQKV